MSLFTGTDRNLPRHAALIYRKLPSINRNHSAGWRRPITYWRLLARNIGGKRKSLDQTDVILVRFIAEQEKL